MRILITNDDGINAPGLAVMQDIAEELAGPNGEVITVAPAFEQSGVAHCISYAHPTMIAKLGEARYAIEGSPADCVLAAIHHVMAGEKPDLVLSGVNRGNNSAENALYSGTLGGAMEAALQGVMAIGMSQYLGPENYHINTPFEAAHRHGADVVRRILATAPEDTAEYRLFYNVNFPPMRAGNVKGIRVTTQGFRPDTSFTVEAQKSPTGRQYLWAKGGNQQIKTAEGSDAAANLDGYISVTPMRADLTAHDALAALKGIE